MGRRGRIVAIRRSTAMNAMGASNVDLGHSMKKHGTALLIFGALVGCSSSAGGNGPTGGDGGADADTAPAEDVRILTGRDEKAFCEFYRTKHVDTATTI